MPTELEAAYATLKAKDFAALATRGHTRNVRAGEVLVAAGDRGYCFYTVLEGSIEIVDVSGEEPRTVVVVHPGQFTGEVNLFTERAALVTARVAEDGRVLELSRAELRHVIDQSAELGETILK